nr:MAG TPA: hypothetical protein [Crassvirales sp.]
MRKLHIYHFLFCIKQIFLPTFSLWKQQKLIHLKFPQ